MNVFAEHVGLKLQDAVDQPQQSEHHLSDSRDPRGRSAGIDVGALVPMRQGGGSGAKRASERLRGHLLLSVRRSEESIERMRKPPVGAALDHRRKPVTNM
jgi:hypothetical protein